MANKCDWHQGEKKANNTYGYTVWWECKRQGCDNQVEIEISGDGNGYNYIGRDAPAYRAITAGKLASALKIADMECKIGGEQSAAGAAEIPAQAKESGGDNG